MTRRLVPKNCGCGRAPIGGQFRGGLGRSYRLRGFACEGCPRWAREAPWGLRATVRDGPRVAYPQVHTQRVDWKVSGLRLDRQMRLAVRCNLMDGPAGLCGSRKSRVLDLPAGRRHTGWLGPSTRRGPAAPLPGVPMRAAAPPAGQLGRSIGIPATRARSRRCRGRRRGPNLTAPAPWQLGGGSWGTGPPPAGPAGRTQRLRPAPGTRPWQGRGHVSFRRCKGSEG